MDPMINEVISWLLEAGAQIKTSLHGNLQIDQKAGRTDLVTDIDRATQRFLAEKIAAFDPTAHILGEENGQDTTDIRRGRVFVIDPIDGTLNFVYEKENFCIMLAIYEEGSGRFGFIYDVMKQELYWGGRGIGVYCNEDPIVPPADRSLSEGLIGMNSHMYAHNLHETLKIGETSMGTRMLGCAGLEMIDMICGRHIGYISRLAPWDYAAGIVLLEELGLKFSRIDGNELSFSGREAFVGGLPTAYAQMRQMIG